MSPSVHARLKECLSITYKYGLLDWLLDTDDSFLKRYLNKLRKSRTTTVHASYEERLTSALLELGPTFIKLGQLLSSRPDIVGTSTATCLSQLQQTVPPDSIEYVNTAIADGIDDSLFVGAVEEKPIGSASIAQVHRIFIDDLPYVVKVRHEGIEQTIEADIAVLTLLAEQAEALSSALASFEPLRLVEFFSNSIRREIDLSNEANALNRMESVFKDDNRIVTPSVFPEATSEKTLVMSHMKGLSVNNYEEMRKLGKDELERFVHQTGKLYLDMVFRDRFFHADPHPGNLMYMDGKTGILDFGMTGQLTLKLRDQVMDILMAVMEQQVEEVTQLLLDMNEGAAPVSYADLERSIDYLVTEVIGRRETHFDMSSVINELIDLVHSNHIRLPNDVMLLLRVLVGCEGMAKRFVPEFSLYELFADYYKTMQLKGLRPDLLLDSSLRDLSQIYRTTRLTIRKLKGEVSSIYENGVEVRLSHYRLDEVVDRLVAGLLTSSLFLGSTLLWINDAPPTVDGVSLLGLGGYIVSIFMGGRLYMRLDSRPKKKRRN